MTGLPLPTAPYAPGVFTGENMRLLLALTAAVNDELSCVSPDPLTACGLTDDAAYLGLADFVSAAVLVVQANWGGLDVYFEHLAQTAGGVPLYDVAEQLALHVQIAVQTAQAEGLPPALNTAGAAAGVALVRHGQPTKRGR